MPWRGMGRWLSRLAKLKGFGGTQPPSSEYMFGWVTSQLSIVNYLFSTALYKFFMSSVRLLYTLIGQCTTSVAFVFLNDNFSINHMLNNNKHIIIMN